MFLNQLYDRPTSRAFDHAFDRDPFALLDALVAQVGPRGDAAPVNVDADDAALTVTVPVPGATAADLTVTVEDGVLTIATARAPAPAGRTWLLRELPVGDRRLAVALPVDVDGDRITAALRDGILTVTLPRSAAARPRTIAVTHGADAR